MKIAYFADIRLPTEKAHGIQVMETCAALAKAGHELDLYISAAGSGDEQAIFAAYGLARDFSIRTIDAPRLLDLGRFGFAARSVMFAHAARKVFAAGSYDAAYTRGDAVTAVLARKPGAGDAPPVFYEIHDARSGLFQKLALKRAAGIVAISQGLAAYCRKRGVPAARIAVAPDGVDLAKFAAAASDTQAQCRAELGLPADAKIALYAGHLYEWKGAHVLAEAAKLLADDPRARVVFVGGTPWDLEAFRARYGAVPNIVIAGAKPHGLMPRYMRAADILVLPNSGKEAISRLYTSPVKLFEYMASGTPLVASDLPSIREIVDEDSAVLVAPDSPEALAAGIESALADPGSAAKRAAYGRAVAANYSWQARAETISAFMGSRPAAKDTAFYDKESAAYSSKRYPARSSQYTHFFFKRRLEIAAEDIRKALKDREAAGVGNHGRAAAPALLEVGCADGVVLRRLYDEFGRRIASYEGIDVSPGMIDAARAQSAGRKIAYAVRAPGSGFAAAGKPDLIVEIGVLNYAGFAADMAHAAESLASGPGARGRFICSVAGRGSLWDRFRRGPHGFADFMSYKECEALIRTHFDIVAARPVGLFIPLIWRIPALARAIQPAAEALLAPIAPGLFHEKAYVLALKRL